MWYTENINRLVSLEGLGTPPLGFAPGEGGDAYGCA